jgi:cyclopropane fatty-acyl-phospholipid synthase-like methyltransferase
MIKKLQCLFCLENNNDYKIIHAKLRYGHPGKIYKCNLCNFVFLYPKLSESEQKEYYSEEYRNEYEEISVDQRFQNDIPEAERRFKDVKEILPSNKKLLEIGSGSGSFLSLSSSYFDHVSGVEPDVHARIFLQARGLNIYSDLEEVKDQKFDAVVMFHVLEHLLDPIAFIGRVSNLLNKGGTLLIEVPNIDDALLKFYDIDEFKDFYYCSAHLSYFSKETLRDCLKKANFGGKISLIQRYDLTNHLNWLKYKCAGGLPKEEKIFDEQTLKAYEADLRSKGLSDTLWGIFQELNNVTGENYG